MASETLPELAIGDSPTSVQLEPAQHAAATLPGLPAGPDFGTRRDSGATSLSGEAHAADPAFPTQVPVRPVDIDAIKRLALPIVPGKLYFTSLSHHPTSSEKARFFTVDYDLAYEPYFADFGPLNISMLVRFCRALRDHLQSSVEGTELFFYSSQTPHLRANAGYLMAGFAVLVLRMAPEEVASLMSRAYPPLLPFRDASYGVAAFQLTVADVVRALHKARLLGWIDVDTFDVTEYERYDKVIAGDWNWIVPGKFIAFSSPIDEVRGREASQVIPAFRERGVSMVVRLNEKRYDRRAFTEVGVRHEELQFPDGSTPSDAIVRQFLQWTENQAGVVAVHCKAGLGRTGTLIGVFMMKHYGFSAREVIAWCRVCRPGSIIGPQQQYLETMQRRLDAAGELYRRQVDLSASASHTAAKTSAGASLKATSASGNNKTTLPVTTGRAQTAAGSMRPGTSAPPGSLGGTLGAAGEATAAAGSLNRTHSPAQRSRPRPLKLVENMPYDIPAVEAERRVTHLQTLVTSGSLAKAEAELAKAAAAANARGQKAAPHESNNALAPAAQVPRSTKTSSSQRPRFDKMATASSGVVRPILPAQAATYVAGHSRAEAARTITRGMGFDL
jgi:cell division cycle 14